MNQQNKIGVPLFSGKVPAGFPSPADEHIEQVLDLNAYIIQNKQATFLLRASGDSMQDAGIFNSDILVVDRSISAKSNHIVVASIDGEFLVKRFMKDSKGIRLISENIQYKPITLKKGEEFLVWGVVTFVIHKL